jgi:hypothetical protein
VRIPSATLLVPALAWIAAVPPARIPSALAAPTTVTAAVADTSKAPAADTARAAPAPPVSPHGHGGMAAPPPGHGGMGTPPPGHGGMAAAPPGGGKSGAVGKPFKIVVPSGTPRVKTVTLAIRHRVFHDFVEADEVRLRELFTIGDTPYSATVTDFLPDFVIDVDARRITSRSNEPKNPALRIVVREDGVVQDTTWAFLNMPPHFSARSLLAFKIMRIDFADRPPVLADTSSTARPPSDPAPAARSAPPADTSSAGKSKP